MNKLANKKYFLLTIFLAFLSTNTAYANYICAADESVGFIYENDQWKFATFSNLSKRKYIIRKWNDKDTYFSKARKKRPYGVFRIGKEMHDYACYRKKEYPLQDNVFSYHCQSPYGQFFFSTRTGNFLLSYTTGYWDIWGKERTPSMTRGKCSTID